MGSVYIPVQNTEEEVRVDLGQLPRDANDILDILKAEQAPLHLWLIIAREYFKQGKIDQFKLVLEEGSGPEIDEYYADVKYERIAILNALGAYYTFLAKMGPEKDKDQNLVSATKFYNRASHIDDLEPTTWIGRAQLLIAKDDLEKANDNFKIVLGENPNSVPGLLGQACVFFLMGEKEENYKKAQDLYRSSLENYKRALYVYPTCPPVVRLGIGYCRYRLGHVSKARQAFLRVLQLDPENVEANVALGVMELQTNEGGGIRRGIELMHRAFEVDPVCPMALNHLANHFFYTGQHFLVEQLTEAALETAGHGLIKAHAYYNLARSYHTKGDYEKAGRYYMASVKEVKKPKEFILPFYGLGQIQLKMKDFKNSLSSFEKVLHVYPENTESLKAIGHIHVQLQKTDKAIETFKKVTRIDPKDAQAFLELGELLIPTDTNAALEALKTARTLLKKNNEDIPIELLNTMGVLHFEKEDFELAEQTFKEALGDGIWLTLFAEKPENSKVDLSSNILNLRDMSVFHQLEEQGISLDLAWDKVTTLFNYARLLEHRHDTQKATILYQYIVFKYPGYVDAYLRLAAIAKSRNDYQLSIELVGDALKVDGKCSYALLLLADLELKSDDWVKAKDTIRAAKDATLEKDSFSNLALGNWNYFAAIRSSEKKGPKLEATHLEKAKELYTKVLKEHRGNMYAANGTGIVLAEKGHFDVSKDLFTQVQEAAASGSGFVHMPDVWINLAHIYFAQGQFSLAIKMYQNCLRKFYYGTDSSILLYLSRTQYEAEQWQDCKKTLLRALHLSPSNPTLRFNAGVAMQKFSALTLQKTKRTADEVRLTVSELKNAVRVFSQLSAQTMYHSHGFDEKKFATHVDYCRHLLEAAKVHCEAAEREEQQTRQRLELARQVSLAEEARRKAEEQRKHQLEKRKQEDELKQIKQQEEHFERVKEQWKSSTHGSGGRRRDRSRNDDEEGGERKRRRGGGGGRKRKNKRREQYEEEEEVQARSEDDNNPDMEYNNDDNNANDDNANSPGNPLAAAGLDDSDADDDDGGRSAAINKKRKAWSESDNDDEPVVQQQEERKSSPAANSEEGGSDGEQQQGAVKRSNLLDDSDDDM